MPKGASATFIIGDARSASKMSNDLMRKQGVNGEAVTWDARGGSIEDHM